MTPVPTVTPEIRAKTPPEALALIDALQAQIGALHAHVADLKGHGAELNTLVAQLRDRLHQNSTNSSRPPSTDPASVQAQRPRRPPSGRHLGGQPGHPPITGPGCRWTTSTTCSRSSLRSAATATLP